MQSAKVEDNEKGNGSGNSDGNYSDKEGKEDRSRMEQGGGAAGSGQEIA